MKRIIFTLCLIIIICMCLSAQRSATSKPQEFHIERDVVPPLLEIEEGSLSFTDANGNNVIDADETCYIHFRVRNKGKGRGLGCIATIDAVGSTNGLVFQDQNLGEIRPDESMSVTIPVKADMNTITGKAIFTVQVTEPHDFGTSPQNITVNTRRFLNPYIQMVSKLIKTSKGKLLRKEKFSLEVMVQNIEQGIADDVRCELTLPSGVVLLGGENRNINLGMMKPGETKTLTYELIASDAVKDDAIIGVALSEHYGKYAENATIPLTFYNGHNTGGGVIVKGESETKPIPRGSLVSDVDENIPQAKEQNINTFALIIANENYQNVASVPFALNDGNIFRQYCEKTLGIPAKNIQYVPDATGNNLKSRINTLRDLIEASKGQAKVLFYYAGHGVPDEKKGNGNAYLLPVDGIGSDYTTGYKLDDLYAALGKYPSRGVTVFLDACFSGGTRVENETLDPAARGVAVSVKRGQPVGQMVVFSAAQGDQTANPDQEQQHGMFTYYLLKKLQETNGDVTLDDLTQYVIDKVSLESVRNRHKQQPCVTPSSEVGTDWKTWTLK